MSTKYIASNWRLPNQAGVDSYLNDNYGLTFSGSSEKINCGDSDVLSFGDGSNDSPFSISLWFNLSTLTTPSCLLCKQTSSSNGEYKIYISTAGKIYIELANNGGEANGARGIISNSTISINQWYNIIFTYDGTGGSSAYDGMNLYINNSLDSSTDFSYLSYTAMNNTTADFVIGDLITGSSNTYDFTGKMSELAVFDYALSSTQISTLYGSSSLGAGNPMALKPAPVAFYPLGDNSSGNPLTQPNEAVEDASVFDFDASSSQFVNVGSASFLNGLSEFTLSCWFKLDNAANDKVIVSDWNYNSNPFGHFALQTFSASGNDFGLYLFIKATSDAGANAVTTSRIFTQNIWYNVIYTFNSGNVTCYVNGDSVTLSTGGTIPTTLTNQDGNLNIGKFGGSLNRYWDGKITNVAIWNTDQTTEVSNIYNSGVPATSYTNTPTVWYKLDQSANWDVSGSGYWDIPDASGNGNDGTSSGMTSANLVLTNLTRNLPYDSYSFNFDAASSDYIDVPTTNSINFTSAFTFSIWFRTTSTASMFTSHGTSSIKYFIQWTGSSNRIRLRIYDSTNAAITIDNIPSQDFDDGNWHHLVFTTDGTTSSNKVIIYLNGQELSNKGTLANTGIKSVTGSMKIGALNDGSNTFDGQLSNVSVFSEALTSTEVLKLYSNGMPQDLTTFTPAPVAWWTLGSNSFFNGSNFICKDLSGNGNDGTSVNAGVDALQGNTPRSEANGTGTNMDIPTNLEGTTKYSSNNSWSINMSESARVADTP